MECAKKERFGLVIGVIRGWLGLIRTLRGLTPKFGSFDDEQFDEVQFERHFPSDPVLVLPECWYWIRMLQAPFFVGRYASTAATPPTPHLPLSHAPPPPPHIPLPP